MRILHISDSHSRHRFLNDLPAADLIVHSGDLSWSGKPDEVLDFRYHLFGHIHDACGMKKINATTFINASILDETCQPANNPFVFEI